MGFMDKVKNKLEMGMGRAKEQAGRASGDKSMEAEGRGDRVSGSVKQVGEQLKDAAKNIKGAASKPDK